MAYGRNGKDEAEQPLLDDIGDSEVNSDENDAQETKIERLVMEEEKQDDSKKQEIETPEPLGDDWQDHIPGLQRTSAVIHPLFKLMAKPKDIEEPMAWSPGERAVHPIRRGLIGETRAAFGSLFSTGRNVPEGKIGVTKDQGNLVLTSSGNVKLYRFHDFLPGAQGEISIAQPPLNEDQHINIAGLVTVVYVPPGYISCVRNNEGQFVRLLEGQYVFEGPNVQFIAQESLDKTRIKLGNIEIINVPEGYIGFAKRNGKLQKLVAGIHIMEQGKRKFLPYEAPSQLLEGGNNQVAQGQHQDDSQKAGFASLRQRVIQFRNYSRMTILGNEAIVYADEIGRLEVLTKGYKESCHPNVKPEDYLPLSQNTLIDEGGHVFKTLDQAEVTAPFNVYYEVDDARKVIHELCNSEKIKKPGDLLHFINERVRQMAYGTLAAVIGHYNLTDQAIISKPKVTVDFGSNIVSLDSGSSSNRVSNSSFGLQQQLGAEKDLMQKIREDFLSQLTEALRAVGIELKEITLSSGLHPTSKEARQRLEQGAGIVSEQAKARSEQAIKEAEAETQRQIELKNAEMQAKITSIQAQAQLEAAQTLAKARAADFEAELKVVQSMAPGAVEQYVILRAQQGVAAALSGKATTLIYGNANAPGFFNGIPMAGASPYQLVNGQQHMVQQAVPQNPGESSSVIPSVVRKHQ